jgi:hypothetical protein
VGANSKSGTTSASHQPARIEEDAEDRHRQQTQEKSSVEAAQFAAASAEGKTSRHKVRASVIGPGRAGPPMGVEAVSAVKGVRFVLSAYCRSNSHILFLFDYNVYSSTKKKKI